MPRIDLGRSGRICRVHACPPSCRIDCGKGRGMRDAKPLVAHRRSKALVLFALSRPRVFPIGPILEESRISAVVQVCHEHRPRDYGESGTLDDSAKNVSSRISAIAIASEISALSPKGSPSECIGSEGCVRILSITASTRRIEKARSESTSMQAKICFYRTGSAWKLSGPSGISSGDSRFRRVEWIHP